MVELLVPAAGNEEYYSLIDCRQLHCNCPVDAPGLSKSGNTPQRRTSIAVNASPGSAWMCLTSGWPPRQHYHSDSTPSYPSSGYPIGHKPLPQEGVLSPLYVPLPKTLARKSETTFQTIQIHRTPIIQMHLMSVPSQLSFELGWQTSTRHSSLPRRDPTIVSRTGILC